MFEGQMNFLLKLGRLLRKYSALLIRINQAGRLQCSLGRLAKFGESAVGRYWVILYISLYIQKIVRGPAPDQIIDLKALILEDLAVEDDEILYQTVTALAIIGRVT